MKIAADHSACVPRTHRQAFGLAVLLGIVAIVVGCATPGARHGSGVPAAGAHSYQRQPVGESDATPAAEPDAEGKELSAGNADSGSAAEIKTVGKAGEELDGRGERRGDEASFEPTYPLDPPPETQGVAAMRDAGELVDQGNLAGARKILLIAARHKPVEPALCLALARVSESLGQWQDAADWYAAAEAHPDSAPDPLRSRQRARCLYRAGDATAACQLWSQSLTGKSRAVPIGELLEYADASLRIDDQDTAQALLDQVSERTGRRSREVELLRATCALRRGDASRAESIATTALREWPNESRFVRLAALAQPVDADATDDR